ncbi:ATP-grasp domain-containing protein [Caulobacter sp. S45]|uniref:ATP-grasp domain-containing protein n=1 Tax=Caulobacter sp. S45 TaxID=1641861 RepID=UPI00131A688F|nr:ATP-grasp domain-containing protein [Caulobacter sp. S45]
MLLLEHDAKEIARDKGVRIPQGVFVARDTVGDLDLLGRGPWVVKAQVGVGGRGKAGGVGFADTPDAVAAFIRANADATIKGHRIAGFRVEEKVSFRHEVYLSFMVDAASRGIRLLLSAQGGVDVEANAHQADAMLTAVAPPGLGALVAAGENLIPALPEALRAPVRSAVAALAQMFLALDATLLEVNPLFVLADGSWVAGDMKLGVDESAFARQPALEAAVRARPDAYPEANFKLDHDFDYVRINPHGQIGLLTTGAGLSMMLIDEMLQAGRQPFNFCDVRTGLLRGSPQRLIDVLRQFTQGDEISVVFVNIFAGITDLGEFADLLLQALDAVPELEVPVVARLIGNNFEGAKARLARSGRPITLEMELDKALRLAVAQVGAAA